MKALRRFTRDRVPAAENVPVPRVSVRVVSKEGCSGVEAVAEISDGRVTATSTRWCKWWWHREVDRLGPLEGDRAGYVEAARRATEEAIQHARWGLAGAQAGHAKDAGQVTS